MEAVGLSSRTLHARVQHCRRSIFLLKVRRIWMFFSLKPFASKGESSLKISAYQVYLFRRSLGTNKHTDSLTYKRFDNNPLFAHPPPRFKKKFNPPPPTSENLKRERAIAGRTINIQWGFSQIQFIL